MTLCLVEQNKDGHLLDFLVNNYETWIVHRLFKASFGGSIIYLLVVAFVMSCFGIDPLSSYRGGLSP